MSNIKKECPKVSNFSFEYLKKSVRLSNTIIERYKKLPDSLKLRIEVDE